MEFAVEASNKKLQKLLENLMPSFIEQLSLKSSRKAVLVKVVDDIDPETDLKGSTLNVEVADCMLVLLKKPARGSKTSVMDLILTLAHEMVHVRQLAKGLLVFLPNGNRLWKGKHYSKKVHYLDQPWELDAFSRQEILCRRAIEV